MKRKLATIALEEKNNDLDKRSEQDMKERNATRNVIGLHS
jgi:hypothetical protein